MTIPPITDETPDDELLNRVRLNSPGNASHESAKTELEFRFSRLLTKTVSQLAVVSDRTEKSAQRMTEFAASTEKSGARMEWATWIILAATLMQLGLVAMPLVRGHYRSTAPSHTTETPAASSQGLSGTTEQSPPIPKTASLDLQEKCARQSQAAFRRDGFEKEQLASFSNHYSEKLNRCFVQYDSTKGNLVSKVVSDAFEGKVYGSYMWRADKVKKYWEVPPIQCTVTLPSGEEKTCHSSDEFDSLVKEYME